MTRSPTLGRLTAEELDALEARLESADARTASFDFAQGSDETGEYYTRRATLSFDGVQKLDLLSGLTETDDWTREDFDALCAAFNAAPALIAMARSLPDEKLEGSPGQDQPSAGVTSPGSESSGWRPMSTSPRGGSRFLAWDAIDAQADIVYWSQGWPFNEAGSPLYDWETCISHWMPLPSSPDETASGISRAELNAPDPRVGELIEAARKVSGFAGHDNTCGYNAYAIPSTSCTCGYRAASRSLSTSLAAFGGG